MTYNYNTHAVTLLNLKYIFKKKKKSCVLPSIILHNENVSRKKKHKLL